jgi:hypothetical protein
MAAIFFDDNAYNSLHRGEFEGADESGLQDNYLGEFHNTIGDWAMKTFTTEEGRERRAAKKSAKTSGKEADAIYKLALAQKLGQEPEKENNTMLYAIAGVALLIVGGVAFFTLKK